MTEVRDYAHSLQSRLKDTDRAEGYQEVFAVGPIVMMKNVSSLTKKFNVPTTVSLNPIMIDGTGMCGGCRVNIGGKTQFCCVHGPEFDGHLVDYDELEKRNSMYFGEEKNSLLYSIE